MTFSELLPAYGLFSFVHPKDLGNYAIYSILYCKLLCLTGIDISLVFVH